MVDICNNCVYGGIVVDALYHLLNRHDNISPPPPNHPAAALQDNEEFSHTEAVVSHLRRRKWSPVLRSNV